MTTARELVGMTRTLIRAARRARKAPDSQDRLSLGLLLQQQAARQPDKTALICEGQQVTWSEFNTRANRVAHQLKTAGIGHGDCVAVMVENRIDFLAAFMGVCKLGAIASLINTHQRREVLVHSLEVTQAKVFLFGEEVTAAVDEVRERLALAAGQDYLWIPDTDTGSPPEWAHVCDPSRSANVEDDPPETDDIILDDPCFYLFTSGTTGLPKAAIMSGERCYRNVESVSAIVLDLRPEDRLYNALPFYHGTGLMIGFCAVLYAGASMVIKRKFSASRFWDEIREYDCTSFVYIGEMCRYLMHQPERPNDADNPIVKCVGNGLRPDIWMAFKQRFGIERIGELYGASEGNAGFANIFNKDRTIGAGIFPHVLVQYDVDNDEILRGADGLCIKVDKGQPGLLLNEVNDLARFDGYTDAEASQRKLIRNVVKQGDLYFNTGDLIRQVKVGFAFGMPHYQFVDRTGDTFRWKGENCSTNEVGEIINACPQVQTTNVYGVQVPNADGRAGMAAITFDPEQVRTDADIDWNALTRHIDANLASYARPLFIRLSREQPTTSTFKLQKTALKTESFHLDQVGSDPIFVRKPGSEVYERLDQAFYQQLLSGQAGY
jgi:citronellyl-CoA synthetase